MYGPYNGGGGVGYKNDGQGYGGQNVGLEGGYVVNNWRMEGVGVGNRYVYYPAQQQNTLYPQPNSSRLRVASQQPHQYPVYINQPQLQPQPHIKPLPPQQPTQYT